MNYYRKQVMRSKVLFSDGSYFDGWERVGDDEGILATEDARVIRELDANIRANTGGVSRLTGEQFLEAQSKKKEPSKPRWREEWRPPVANPLEQLLQGNRVPSNAAVPAAATEPSKPVAPPPDSQASFRPKTTKA